MPNSPTIRRRWMLRAAAPPAGNSPCLSAHVVKANEIIASMLLTWHNLTFYQDLMAGLRGAIGMVPCPTSCRASKAAMAPKIPGIERIFAELPRVDGPRQLIWSGRFW